MAAYAGLERYGMKYILTNIAVTSMLTLLSFLSSHKWSLIACGPVTARLPLQPYLDTPHDIGRKLHVTSTRQLT
jgi:hypothetical protein